eukprot:1723102-Pyramimonas_sp.AAC.1
MPDGAGGLRSGAGGPSMGGPPTCISASEGPTMASMRKHSARASSAGARITPRGPPGPLSNDAKSGTKGVPERGCASWSVSVISA